MVLSTTSAVQSGVTGNAGADTQPALADVEMAAPLEKIITSNPSFPRGLEWDQLVSPITMLAELVVSQLVVPLRKV